MYVLNTSTHMQLGQSYMIFVSNKIGFFLAVSVVRDSCKTTFKNEENKAKPQKKINHGILENHCSPLFWRQTRMVLPRSRRSVSPISARRAKVMTKTFHKIAPTSLLSQCSKPFKTCQSANPSETRLLGLVIFPEMSKTSFTRHR